MLKDFIQLERLTKWEDARKPLDSFLNRLNTRLDQQEGRSGTPQFFNDIDMVGHRITNGPTTGDFEDNEFITKGFGDTVYGAAAIRAALQISGTHPMLVTDLPGGIGASGTINRVAKFQTVANLSDSQIWDVPSVTVGSAYYNTEIGTTTPTATDSMPLYVLRAQNASTDIVVVNTTSGASARASVRAVAGGAGTPDLFLGVSSAAYALGGGLAASQGIIYTGAGTTAGLSIQTTAGPLMFQIAGTTTVQMISADNSHEFTTSSTAAVGAAGTARLRNNAGVLELSNNGGAYSAIGTAAGSYWSQAADPQGGGRVNVTPTTLTDRVIVGLASSDITDQGIFIANQFVYAISGIANATVAAMGFDAGTSTVRFASGISGAGTYRDIQLLTNNAINMVLSTLGNVLIGSGTTSFDDTTQGALQVTRAQNTGLWILARNSTSGTLAYTAIVARSGASGSGNDVTMAISSAGFTTASGIPASTASIITGANTTGGFILQTQSGTIKFQPAGTTTLVTISNASNIFLVNNTADADVISSTSNGSSGASARAIMSAASNGGTISIAATSTGYVLSGFAADQGILSAESLSGGLVIYTGAGDITFKPAGTTTTVTMSLGSILLNAERAVNGDVIVKASNTTAGTAARGMFTASADAATISVGVTSSSYTPSGALSADQSFIASENASNGMVIYTDAGSILFKVGGTGTDVTFDTTGGITCTGLSATTVLATTVSATTLIGAGSSITALNANNISSGTLAVARGGTNQTAFTSTRITYFDGTSLTGSANLVYSTDITLTSGSYLIATTGKGVGMTSDFILFNTNNVEGYAGGGTVRFKWDTTNNATDSGILVYFNGSLRRAHVDASDLGTGVKNYLYLA